MTKEIPTAICEWCHKPFTQNRKDKVYCCRNCKVYAHLKAKLEAKKKEKKNV